MSLKWSSGDRPYARGATEWTSYTIVPRSGGYKLWYARPGSAGPGQEDLLGPGGIVARHPEKPVFGSLGAAKAAAEEHSRRRAPRAAGTAGSSGNRLRAAIRRDT